MERGLWYFTLFLVLCSLPVFAEFVPVSLRVGESRDIDGVNFTLLRTNVDDDKVVLCMNGQKVIVDNEAGFGKATVEVDDVFDRSANLRVEVACGSDCECDESCLNDACFISMAQVPCNVNAECNDENPDTTDLCVNNVCENRAVPLQTCVLDSECDDNNPCTVDNCNSLVKRCTHEEIQNCTTPEETPQQPTQEKPTQVSSISFAQVSTLVLLGLVVILLVAVVIRRAVK
ncbi:MAG: hypothetical protein V1645_00970 [archaeon]